MICEHCGHEVRMRQPLTRKQREILNYIIDYSEAFGCAPSFEEIAKYFGYDSLATVHEHLGNLERNGWITRAYKQPRSITVIAGR